MAGALVAAALLLTSAPSQAISYYYLALSAKYPATSDNGCAFCDVKTTGGSSRNTYGAAFEVIVDHVADPGATINILDTLDSDADGFANAAELTAGINPGNPNFYPALLNPAAG